MTDFWEKVLLALISGMVCPAAMEIWKAKRARTQSATQESRDEIRPHQNWRELHPTVAKVALVLRCAAVCTVGSFILSPLFWWFFNWRNGHQFPLPIWLIVVTSVVTSAVMVRDELN